MGKNEDYVDPPNNGGRDGNNSPEGQGYVAPPTKNGRRIEVKKGNYVAPPRDNSHENKYVSPYGKKTQGKYSQDDYVPPPSKTQGHVVPKTNVQTFVSSKQEGKRGDEGPFKKNNINIPHNSSDATRNLKLPKQGLGFYLSGYLFWLLLFIYFGDMTSMWKVIAVVYVLASNYTFCWYAGYKRNTPGLFSWFFTSFGGVKAGFLAFAFRTFFIGLVVMIVVEFFKLIITIPIAFITLFTHNPMKIRYLTVF